MKKESIREKELFCIPLRNLRAIALTNVQRDVFSHEIEGLRRVGWASEIMQQRALSNPKIEVIWNSSVVEAYEDENGKGVLGGLKVKNVVTGDV
ncbi:unnamed protein product [Eruca vesicaria subsp. sativa]|uniref:Uncharacterized protein n=1 Tax=Eruca vesicaria subsp. sativa TaxID=29727 RepID=A0ABC8KSQ5_ERUVS|nr:unnamed protein product [Eruca vesicaria subsp. sativa]